MPITCPEPTSPNVVIRWTRLLRVIGSVFTVTTGAAAASVPAADDLRAALVRFQAVPARSTNAAPAATTPWRILIAREDHARLKQLPPGRSTTAVRSVAPRVLRSW